jgi:hypothetical protein
MGSPVDNGGERGMVRFHQITGKAAGRSNGVCMRQQCAFRRSVDAGSSWSGSIRPGRQWPFGLITVPVEV